MNEQTNGGCKGCSALLVTVALLLWFGAVPPGARLVVDAVLGDTVGAAAAEGLSVVVAALATVVPFAGLALALERREDGGGLAALVSCLAVASGYVVVEAATRVVLPQGELPVPLVRRYALSGLRAVILVPYACASAGWAARRSGGNSRTLVEWLGLGRSRWSSLWLASAAAGLLSLPWAVTGALGDSLTSLAVAAETVTSVVPEILVFWGVIFILLSSSLASRRTAAALSVLIYSLAALGRGVVGGGLGQAGLALFILPLGLLLAESRGRGARAPALMPLALLYRLVPRLLVDPRDAVANGIPELQHVLSYVLVGVGAAVLATILWLGRRAAARRRTRLGSDEAPTRAPAVRLLGVAALVAWSAWAGLYVFAGQPGSFNDGFLIILEEQADVGFAEALAEREARADAVYEQLVETAEERQRPIRRQLDELGVSYRPYYIINMIRVDGHRWLMGRFEGQPGVAQVVLNPNVRRYPRRIPMPYGPAGEPEGVQGNLAAVGADRAWELGARGEGIVVGGQDTGYDWEHPALKGQYRGWDGEAADHSYNWHDAWDGTLVPFDDGSHGTHTMGTAVGDDGGENRVGVAPGATWIGCRNMRRGFGNPGSYAACMEFLLAPYPPGGDPFQDGDVALGADVVNNSWGCPRMEGCLPDTLRPAVEALRAAGVMMVVSVGNEGPGCESAGTPPAGYDASFSVGATTDEGEVVGFSSRGPESGLIKPDIAAPGYEVRSALPGGGYGTAGGTSMAAPHVTGAVALVWSADRTLVGDVEGTEALLCRTAQAREVSRSCDAVGVPEGPFAAVSMPPSCACGGVTGVPNNVYGCGVVNAGAAVKAVLGE